jgi:UDP-2,3-diacylglucosamine hydrolase
MSQTLFISDLHLSAERPQINEQFFAFMRNIARDAEALYILGDLFEYWAGDDDLQDPLHDAVARALDALRLKDTPVYLMHGNRDLLIGAQFARQSGARLIADPTVIDLYGMRTLLMHGDTLCTDDIEYQRFRRYAHDPGNQAQFLAQPLAARREQMLAMRAQSEQKKSEKSNEIMDVSQDAVLGVLRQHGYPRLIHGHTHRPARHLHHVDRHDCERWVLTDWYEHGGYLRCTTTGCEAVTL